MKVVLADSLNDITLGKYQKYMSLDSTSNTYTDEIFSFFTDIPLENVKEVPKKEYDDVLTHIFNALQKEGEFKQRFKIDNLEFGLIPNFDKITGAEYVDIVASSKEIEGYNKDLVTLISVLYRPIKKKDSFGNYKIEKYKGTKGHEKYIEKLPMSIVNGCLGFFLNLLNDLEMRTQKYMEEEQLKEQLL